MKRRAFFHFISGIYASVAGALGANPDIGRTALTHFKVPTTTPPGTYIVSLGEPHWSLRDRFAGWDAVVDHSGVPQSALFLTAERREPDSYPKRESDIERNRRALFGDPSEQEPITERLETRAEWRARIDMEPARGNDGSIIALTEGEKRTMPTEQWKALVKARNEGLAPWPSSWPLAYRRREVAG